MDNYPLPTFTHWAPHPPQAPKPAELAEVKATAPAPAPVRGREGAGWCVSGLRVRCKNGDSTVDFGIAKLM